MSLTFTIAKTHLLAKKRQTLVATLGVTFGIAMFIVMVSFMTGINNFMDETLLSASPHIHIYKDVLAERSNVIDNVYDSNQFINVVLHQKPKREDTNIKYGLNIAKSIALNSTVDGVSPHTTSRVFFNYGALQINGNVLGVNILEEDKLLKLHEKMTEGKIENLLTNRNGLLMGAGLAKKMNVHTGNRVTITTPQGVLMTMKVVGIFQMGMAALDDSRSYANLAAVQTILQKDKSYITDINVRLKDMNNSTMMAKEFSKVYGYRAADWKEENASILSTFIIRNVMTVVVVLTMLIVAGFGIYNIMSMTINDKMKDIAILKATGFSGKDVRAIFLNQATIIGVLGGTAGLLFGFIISFLIYRTPFNGGGFLNINHFPVNFNPLFYVFGFTFGILTTIIAAYMPSRRASKIDPVAILRA